MSSQVSRPIHVIRLAVCPTRQICHALAHPRNLYLIKQGNCDSLASFIHCSILGIVDRKNCESFETAAVGFKPGLTRLRVVLFLISDTCCSIEYCERLYVVSSHTFFEHKNISHYFFIIIQYVKLSNILLQICCVLLYRLRAR